MRCSKECWKTLWDFRGDCLADQWLKQHPRPFSDRANAVLLNYSRFLWLFSSTRYQEFAADVPIWRVVREHGFVQEFKSLYADVTKEGIKGLARSQNGGPNLGLSQWHQSLYTTQTQLYYGKNMRRMHSVVRQNRSHMWHAFALQILQGCGPAAGWRHRQYVHESILSQYALTVCSHTGNIWIACTADYCP